MSTVKSSTSTGGLGFLPGSTWIAVTSWSPSGRPVVGVKDQVPFLSTVVLPISVPLSMMWITAPGTPPPVMVGCESSVTSPLANWPWIGPTSSITLTLLGSALVAFSW